MLSKEIQICIFFTLDDILIWKVTISVSLKKINFPKISEQALFHQIVLQFPFFLTIDMLRFVFVVYQVILTWSCNCPEKSTIYTTPFHCLWMPDVHLIQRYISLIKYWLYANHFCWLTFQDDFIPDLITLDFVDCLFLNHFIFCFPYIHFLIVNLYRSSTDLKIQNLEGQVSVVVDTSYHYSLGSIPSIGRAVNESGCQSFPTGFSQIIQCPFASQNLPTTQISALLYKFN